MDEPRRKERRCRRLQVMASNAATPIAAMVDEARKFYGVQFHPEVTHTLQGKAILGRFVHEICGCGQTGRCPTYIDEASGGSGPKWVTMRSSWAFPAASIHRWRRR